MKVKDLIKALKKFNQNAEVVYSHIDTSDEDYAGEVSYVDEAAKSLCEKEATQPELLIVIHG